MGIGRVRNVYKHCRSIAIRMVIQWYWYSRYKVIWPYARCINGHKHAWEVNLPTMVSGRQVDGHGVAIRCSEALLFNGRNTVIEQSFHGASTIHSV
eukprot:4007593-Lingulodinium_polyedra.AAC.1